MIEQWALFPVEQVTCDPTEILNQISMNSGNMANSEGYRIYSPALEAYQFCSMASEAK